MNKYSVEITLSISSSGSHGNFVPNHSLKYQGDESRREKLNSKSIVASKLQIRWHIATSSPANQPKFS